MKKVLHVTNWYPNKWDNVEGIYVKEQFDVFSRVTDGRLLHVRVRNAPVLLKYEHVRYSENEEGYYLLTRFTSFKIIEILTTLLLLWALMRTKYKQYDLLHFHIAYPLLIHYYLWKKWIKVPIVLSEHWTAYHFNFHMPKTTSKLDSIKRIFGQGIPLITVSKALLKDIQQFSGHASFPTTVIPNIINKRFFRPIEFKKVRNAVPTFFIVNIWTDMKNPFPLLEACVELYKSGGAFHLKIGGYGVLLDSMKRFVEQNNMQNSITFLGKLNKEEIAKEYSLCDAYLFASKYETFSVVCAEALCSGTPLMGPNMEAVLEYTRPDDILVVEQNNSVGWVEALKRYVDFISKFTR